MSDEHIPVEEESLLEKVLTHLETAPKDPPPSSSGNAQKAHKQLLELRDEIAESRLEDVPALVAQMERISGVAARRAEVSVVPVDPSAPYFAHMRLSEEGKQRDVLIGRTTLIDSRSGVRIVDWRHAPVSQLYYRYPEGSAYEESFGGRDVEGEVLVRRTVTIHEGKLLRIHAPQGIFVKRDGGSWRHLETRSAELGGGQGTAARPDKRGVLGVGPDGEQRMDRHLPEIAALLDPRQFELISAPDAGVVVIQGGAGSGKTTIGLHRIAYLAYRQPARFVADKLLVITYGPALAAYISEVLPSLGVPGVRVETFQGWAEARRRGAYPFLEVAYEEDTPLAVTRLKKHPALLRVFADKVAEYAKNPRAKRSARAALSLWAECLTDSAALRAAIDAYGGEGISERELALAVRWCADRCEAMLDHEQRDQDLGMPIDERAEDEGLRPKARERDHELRGDDEGDDDTPSEEPGGDVGVDGLHVDDELLRLDREDDALLLRLYQLLVGPLKRQKQPLAYEHLFVDEAQDLSPVELAVLLGTTSAARSVTLAGDTAQKLYLDNGFSDWRGVLNDLGLRSTDIEPLRIAYRSTREVVSFAREVLGPLAEPNPPAAPRTGAPVEAHVFPQVGAAVAFLGDVLRPLMSREPRATVGILARYPEQADAYYEGLKRSEVPSLRRVRAQDFSFRPGVDVTDIRQVKGLEFDYVVLVDVNASVFPEDDAARHLLHIGATRAAHQLWVIVSGPSSPLLPSWLFSS